VRRDELEFDRKRGGTCSDRICFCVFRSFPQPSWYYVEITKIFQIQEKLDEIFVKEELRDDGFEEVNSTLVLRKNGDSETLNITLYRSSEKNPVFVFMYAK